MVLDGVETKGEVMVRVDWFWVRQLLASSKWSVVLECVWCSAMA